MIVGEKISVSTLLQLNATILVGVFIFITIFPLAFSRVTVPDPSLTVSEKQFMRDIATVHQTLIKQKSNLESILNANISDSSRHALTNVINIYQTAIQQIEEITNLKSQLSDLYTQDLDILNKSSAYAYSGLGYVAIYFMIIFIGFSIIFCISPVKYRWFNTFTLAKLLTVAGILSIVISFIFIINNASVNAKELTKQANKDLKTINDLSNRVDKLYSDSAQTAYTIHGLQQNLSNVKP